MFPRLSMKQYPMGQELQTCATFLRVNAIIVQSEATTGDKSRWRQPLTPSSLPFPSSRTYMQAHILQR